jgi:hypothetical protein
MVDLFYIFLLLKMSYILETFLGELGKKPFLTSDFFIFHHVIILVLTWFGANYHPGGHSTLLGFVNCISKTFADSYYLFFSLLFPELKKKSYSVVIKNVLSVLVVRV